MKLYIEEKSFGSKVVFSSLALDFPEGKTTLLMAPSGWGKTTLLRILSHLDEDWKGRIEGGEGKAVVLFQENRLIENISVLSNLKALGVREDRIRAGLEQMGLSGEEKTKVRELSGGMKRRVSILRVLLTEGDAFFLDEPFTGLDYETKLRCSEVIKGALKNKTVIVVSHNREDGELLSAENIIEIGEQGGGRES